MIYWMKIKGTGEKQLHYTRIIKQGKIRTTKSAEGKDIQQQKVKKIQWESQRTDKNTKKERQNKHNNNDKKGKNTENRTKDRVKEKSNI